VRSLDTALKRRASLGKDNANKSPFVFDGNVFDSKVLQQMVEYYCIHGGFQDSTRLPLVRHPHCALTTVPSIETESPCS